LNFPVGSVVGSGPCPFDLMSTIKSLQDKHFNGYIILAVRGSFIEEGVLFFREGVITACVVECLGADKLVKGNDSMSYFANQSKGDGFSQVVSLTRSQVDLILAFDEKLLLDKIDLKDIPKIIPSVFVPTFSKAAEQKSALEAYGLGDLK